MNSSAIIVVVLVLLIAYYLYTKRSKPLILTGYADNEIVAYLDDQVIFTNTDWTKKFNWTGEAKSGDTIKFVVKNTGGPAGLVCMLNFDGQVAYSNPSMFQTNEPMNACNASDVSRWWSAASLTGMEQAKWIWTGTCADAWPNTKTNTFNYVLP
jgi:hypothetical protein